LTQLGPGLSAGSPSEGLPTVGTSLIVGDYPERETTNCEQNLTYRSHDTFSLTASLAPSSGSFPN
jgi:hypothetical protein